MGKTKKQLQEEERKKKADEKRAYDLRIRGIMDSLDKLGKSFDAKEFEIAVGRWKTAKQEKRAAEKAIADAEAKLAETKRRYGR